MATSQQPIVSLIYLNKFARKKIGPEQIWNVDEKGFNPDPLPKRVVAGRKGTTVQVYQKSHDHVIANICISTAGVHLPPQLIFNRKRLASSLASNGPPGVLFSTSDSGLMDRDLFITWCERIVLAGTSRSRCQLLIFDNHASHICVKLLGMAWQANMVLLAMPSKTTHLLQPLDRNVFSSLAAQHHAISVAVRFLWPEHTLTLKHFVPIFTEAFQNSVTPANILASHRITGVSPINRQAISSSLMTPEVFTTPVHASPQWTDEETFVTSYDPFNETLKKCPGMGHPPLPTQACCTKL